MSIQQMKDELRKKQVIHMDKFSDAQILRIWQRYLESKKEVLYK